MLLGTPVLWATTVRFRRTIACISTDISRYEYWDSVVPEPFLVLRFRRIIAYLSPAIGYDPTDTPTTVQYPISGPEREREMGGREREGGRGREGGRQGGREGERERERWWY
eukprot:933763-Rhodomonas_salina.1